MHDARTRIEELRAAIRKHDHLYHNLGRPEITDAEYDELFCELSRLERAHPELDSPDSPTHRVGAPLAAGVGFRQEAHLSPMLSIESLTSEAEVAEFEERVRRLAGTGEGERIDWVVEPKYDGVSASLLYEDGRLVRTLTRGDGAVGEDVTRNLRTVRNIPLTMLGAGPFPKRVEIRGEVIMTKEVFARLREEQEATAVAPFRNARNAVAGMLKRLDPAEVASRHVEFICWGTGTMDGVHAETYGELLDTLSAFGFKVSPLREVVAGVAAIIDYHHRLEGLRESLDHELDGIVAKVSSLALQRRLGRTARSSRWALAYKFAPRRGITRVERIHVQVGRTGVLTPVALLEPIELAGVVVKRASLHNEAILAQKDVREGDRVEVERAGDVIPDIVRVIPEDRPAGAQPFAMPSHCPTCGETVAKEGAFVFCVNIDCPDQIRGRIVHLAGRRALDIDRLGPKYVDQLFEAGLLRRVEDVFLIPAKREEILALPRWGERSFAKLAEEIQAAKSPPLGRFLYALGIRQVGETTARDLAEHFETLEALAAATEEQMMEVEGVGPEVAKSASGFFALPRNRAFLEAVREAGVVVRRPERATGDLASRVFCFTGGMSAITRDEAKAAVEARGASTVDGISKKVTHVVAGEGAGTKLDKARKLSLAILTEQEFLALIGR